MTPATSAGALRIFLDVGTTNSRGWLVAAGEVLARATAPVGVRDTARTGSHDALIGALGRLIAGLRDQAPVPPSAVCAAGMITSSLGLEEIPHVAAPAGAADLVAGARWLERPEVTDLPMLLLPGVRTLGDAAASDVMRGEETLCLGLLEQGHVARRGRVLNVGSHWKLIDLDERGRVAGSVTSLGGEAVHALQSSTVLSASLPAAPPAMLDLDRVKEGAELARRDGWLRAAFVVRLLDQAGGSTPEARYTFLVGATVADALDALARQALPPGAKVTVCGTGPATFAWQALLIQGGWHPVVLAPFEVEAAFLVGLGTLADQARARPPGKI